MRVEILGHPFQYSPRARIRNRNSGLKSPDGLYPGLKYVYVKVMEKVSYQRKRNKEKL